MKNIAIAIILATLSVPVFSAQSEPKTLQKIGSVSASSSTLTEMEAELHQKAIEQGATDYKITSAKVGNRVWGTAAIYR